MMNKLTMLPFELGLFFECRDPENYYVTLGDTIKEVLQRGTNAQCHNTGPLDGSLDNYKDDFIFIAHGPMLGALRHDDCLSSMLKVSEMWIKNRIKLIEDWITKGLLR